jgi:hypothetical protein
VPLKENIDPMVQGQCQEMAGSPPVKEDNVELTFDEIAGAYSEEEVSRAVFGPCQRR